MVNNITDYDAIVKGIVEGAKIRNKFTFDDEGHYDLFSTTMAALNKAHQYISKGDTNPKNHSKYATMAALVLYGAKYSDPLGYALDYFKRVKDPVALDEITNLITNKYNEYTNLCDHDGKLNVDQDGRLKVNK